MPIDTTSDAFHKLSPEAKEWVRKYNDPGFASTYSCTTHADRQYLWSNMSPNVRTDLARVGLLQSTPVEEPKFVAPPQPTFSSFTPLDASKELSSYSISSYGVGTTFNSPGLGLSSSGVSSYSMGTTFNSPGGAPFGSAASAFGGAPFGSAASAFRPI